MKTTIARQLWEFSRRNVTERDGTAVPEPPAASNGPQRRAARRAALAALALLPFRRLFLDAGVSAKIEEFVYTFH